MDALLQDLRFAIRQFLKHPALAVSAIVTLAIGMAVMTVAFSAVNAFFIKGNAGSHVEGTGWIFTSAQPDAGRTSLPEFERLRDAAADALVTAVEGRMPLAWKQANGSETIWGLLVSSDYFSVLDAKPLYGRTLSGMDREAAVVSERFWRERLAEASLSGLHLTINNVDVAVVGVMAVDFRGPGGTYAPEVWVPLESRALFALPPRLAAPDHWWLTMIGRLRAGATVAEADARLLAGAAAVGREFPTIAKNRGARFAPMRDGFPVAAAGSLLRWIAAAAMSGVGLVLLLACFNVANLLLAHAIDREREMGIRAAVGADTRRIVRQLMTEGLVLATLAGVFATVIAFWSQDLLAAFALPSPIPQRIDVSPDSTVLGFVGVLVLIAGLVPGLAPARHAARVNLARALSSHAYATSGSRSWGRRMLVVLQVTGSTILLTLSLLFVRSFMWVSNADPGFEADRAIVVEIEPSLQNYNAARSRLLVERFIDRLAALPGVISATAADRIPFYVGYPRMTAVAADNQSCANAKCPEFVTYAIGPRYFSTLNVGLAAGREFSGVVDEASSVIVNQTFAQRLWPNESAVGHTLRIGERGDTRVVIGVVRDTKQHAFSESPVAAVYVPLADDDFNSRLTVVARTNVVPGSLVAAVQRAASDVDPAVPPVSIKTMSQRLEGARYIARTGSGFFGTCGILALVLATTGLFAVISHAVGQRTREFGVRLAIGASPRTLITAVLSSSARLVTPGLLIGLMTAGLLANLIAAMFVGVDLRSPVIYLVVALLQATVALAACLAPAQRAARTDPLLALRAD